MALSTCFSHARIFLQNDMCSKVHRTRLNLRLETRHDVSRQSFNIQHFCQNPLSEQSLGLGCMTAARPKINTTSLSKKRPGICSCWMVGSQIASNAFTLGTAAVLPFYTLMVFAPKAEMTKKAMDSSIPYVMLGLVYAYLLYLSWTPDTIKLMFASKYWLPELPGIAKMFSNEMTLSSAWIHLLIVDLFAARRIYHDGLENKIETRHSVSMCLLVCPIGILMHTITKALTRTRAESSKHNHLFASRMSMGRIWEDWDGNIGPISIPVQQSSLRTI